MKIIRIAISVFMLIVSTFSLSACSSKIDSLDGYWKEISQNETWHEAVIQNGIIEINWVSSDMNALYWRGTYVPPNNSVSDYSWTSNNIIPEDEFNMLASNDKTKIFTYNDEILSYSASAMGVTKTVKLKLIEKYENQNNNESFYIKSNIDNCDISNDNISIKVDNSINAINMLNVFEIPSIYSWDLYSEIECYPSTKITSKNINLNIFSA